MNRSAKIAQQMREISKEITKVRNQLKYGTANGFSSGKKLTPKAIENRKLKIKKLDKKWDILNKRYLENLAKERDKEKRSNPFANKRNGFGSRG